MNNKALTLALAMAGVAVFFVQSYVSSVEDDARRKLGTEVVVVRARADIAENETIKESHIVFDSIPKAYAEPSAVKFPAKNEDAMRAFRALIGTVALIPIRSGEQITYNKITEPGMRTGLAPQITPGRRAISVPVNDYSSVSRLVKPGDRVDVIAILDRGGKKEAKVTKTILQDVMVLAVGQYVSNNVARLVEYDGNQQKVKNLHSETNYGSVTLEVEPLQAQIVATAMANNDSGLSLLLRNNDDPDRAQIQEMGLDDLIGLDLKNQRAPAKSR